MIRAVLIIAVLISAVSCRKTLEKPSRDIDALVPLATGTLRIQNAVEDSGIEIGSGGLINIRYRSAIFQYRADDIFSPGDFQTEFTFSPASSQTIPPGNTAVQVQRELAADIQMLLRHIVFSEGTAAFTVNTSFNQKALYTIELPGFAKEGTPLSLTREIDAGGTGQASIDLAGIYGDLSGSGSDRYNTFPVKLTVTNAPESGTLELTPQDEISITVQFKDVKAEKLRGYLGQPELKVTETAETELFDNFYGGVITPKNAQLELTVSNKTGTDVRVLFPRITAVSGNGEKNLDHAITSRPITISRAGNTGGSITPKHFKSEITPPESNINEFVSILPRRFETEADIRFNPQGDLANGNDFYFAGHGLDIDFNLTVPLVIRAENLIFQDELTFSLNEDQRESADRIRSGNLVLLTYNGYPLNAYVQGYWADIDGVIIDSLFSQPEFVNAAEIDPDTRRVTQKTENRFEIPLNPARIENLYQTEKLIFKAHMNTAGQPDTIPFYNDYQLDIKLTGDFKYNLNLY